MQIREEHVIEKDSDEKMVKLAREGSRDAMEELLQKYKVLVKKRAASYYMAGADRDDVIQEGMIGVFKAIRDYDDSKGASFSTFAELCINRQIATAIKATSRYKHSPLNNSMSLNKPFSENDEEGATLEETIISNTSEDPEAMLLLREELDYIGRNGGDLLSSFEHRVWELYLQGVPYSQIARLTGKTPKAVDNAIMRAKKKLEPFLSR